MAKRSRRRRRGGRGERGGGGGGGGVITFYFGAKKTIVGTRPNWDRKVRKLIIDMGQNNRCGKVVVNIPEIIFYNGQGK